MTETIGDIIVWIATGVFTLLFILLVAYGLGEAAGKKMPPIKELEE